MRLSSCAALITCASAALAARLAPPTLARPDKTSLGRLRGGESSPPADEAAWDYIIVGGGAAGCVLADRLSANPENRVLLLEAGEWGSNDMRIRIPAGLVKVFKSERDWDFDTEPVPGTSRGVYLCRGKVMGGSSSTNVMLYHRGAPADYESWVNAGAVGWGPSEVLDYFLRAEDNVPEGGSQYHGSGGPMSVSYVPYVNKLSEAFLDACGKLGYRRNLDFNDWSAPQDGFGRFKVTQRNGERCSTANAYLEGPNGALQRPNLRVQSGAHVTKVALDGAENDLCACAVEYRTGADGDVTLASLASGGEVLLAAGAVQSPQILMLSGIGPREHLEEHGIEVRKDLPGVGEGLQDHPAVLVSYGCKKAICLTDEIRLMGTGAVNPITMLKWMLFGKGALTSVACSSAASSARRRRTRSPTSSCASSPPRRCLPTASPPSKSLARARRPAWLHRAAHRGAAAVGGARAAALGGPAREAAPRERPPEQRRRRGHPARGHQARAHAARRRELRPVPGGGGVPVGRRAERRRHRRVRALHRPLGERADRLVPDGERRQRGCRPRPGAPRPRDRLAPRDRRVGDAAHHRRTDVCPDDHDRREGLRPRAAAARRAQVLLRARGARVISRRARADARPEPGGGVKPAVVGPCSEAARRGCARARSNPAGGAERWRGAVEDAHRGVGRAHTRLRGDEQHSAWERSIGPRPLVAGGRER